jgi:hypothetical protein
MSKITVNELPVIYRQDLTYDDYLMVWSEATETTRKLALSSNARWLTGAVPPASSSTQLAADGVYYMSDADPGAGVTVIATDNATKWLYQGSSGLHAESGVLPTDTPLTHDEAECAQSSRLFHDFTGDSFEVIAERMRPIMLADRVSLLTLRNVTSGYFHSKDLTLPEIQAEMFAFGDALNGALAGSVESCLAALQAMQLAGTTYTEDYCTNGANWQVTKPVDGVWTGSRRVTYTFYGQAHQMSALGFGGSIIDLYDGEGTGNPPYIQIPCINQQTALDNLNTAGMKLQFHHPDFDTVSWDTDGNFAANGSNKVRWTGTPGNPESIPGLDALIDNMYTNNDGQWTISFTNQANTEKDQLIEWLIHALEVHIKKFPR